MEQSPQVPTPAASRRSDSPIGAVAVIASAGGVPALIELLGRLPTDFALPIFVAQHLPRRPCCLNTILSWHSRLKVAWAANAERPLRGHVYLTPPGMCLGMNADGFVVSPLAARSTSWLDSADHLITGVVHLYGARTIAIVLSGSMPAGAQGIRAVNACGGITMAQNRASASDFEMPCSAIDFGKADIVMSPSQMASAIQVIADQWETADTAEIVPVTRNRLEANI